MTAHDDVGPAVLDFLFDALRIDAEWSLREPRAFAWWGHRLPQRVWAEPPASSHDHHVVRIHAATTVLRNVPDTPELRARLATTNRVMSLGALVGSVSSRRIILHSAACFHAQNTSWLQSLFLATVGLQVADAHIKADGLARVLGGEPDISTHPRSGPRREPDDILNVIAAVIAPGGSGPSPWTEADFAATSEITPRPWVLATGGAGGMTAEFPFTGDLPAVVTGRPETALLTASSTERHPQLGSGLLLRLQLPFNVSKEKGSDIAWMLNILEATEQTNTHALGAWCLGPTPPNRTDAHSVTFVSFIPARANGCSRSLRVFMPGRPLLRNPATRTASTFLSFTSCRRFLSEPWMTFILASPSADVRRRVDRVAREKSERGARPAGSSSGIANTVK